MATVPATPKSEVVRFDPNVPQELATRFPEGRRVAGMNGDRIMYSLTDGRVMFLDPQVADEVDKLGLAPNETFFIAKQSAGRSPAGRTMFRWNVWLSPATEKARAAAEAPAIERELKESVAIAEAAKAERKAAAEKFAEARAIREQRDAIRGDDTVPPSAAPVPNPAEAPAAWAQLLLERTQILTDVYAKAIAYGLAAHEGRVKPDEIRSLMVTAFINLSGGKTAKY